MSDAEFKSQISKINISLMGFPDTVFFASLCMSLKHRIVDNFPTAYADGKNLRITYGKEFWNKQTMGEKTGLTLHEVLHIVLQHTDPDRVANRIHSIWNMAADYVINLIIDDLSNKFGPNIIKLPEGGLLDQQYRDMSTEQVYSKLIEQGQKADPNFIIDLRNGEPGEGEESGGGLTPQELQVEIQQILNRAATVAKMAGAQAGAIPGVLQRLMDNLNNPKLPLEKILSRFFNQTTKRDYSWQRPNRRYLPKHYIPSLYSKKMEDITVFIDVSGSVSQEQFTQMISEITPVIRNFNPDTLNLVQFECKITGVDKIKNIGDMALVEFKGGGGTMFHEPVEYMRKHMPNIVLVFTDGYFDMPDLTGVTNNIFWLINDNKSFTVNKGKVYHYETE